MMLAPVSVQFSCDCLISLPLEFSVVAFLWWLFSFTFYHIITAHMDYGDDRLVKI